MEVIRNSQKRVQNKSDVAVTSRTLVMSHSNTKENKANAIMFLARHGLKAERLIVSEYVPELKSLEKVPQEQAETICQAMSQIAYWRITPMGGKPLDAAGAKGENFDLKAELEGEALRLQLNGRLDTLTAPGLLAFFEKTAEENTVSGVSVDCGSLDYISSAGLRVLLIMQKRCKEGVTLRGINDTVRDILEQTGFDEILKTA